MAHRFDSRGLVMPTYLEHVKAVDSAKLGGLYGEGVIMYPEQMEMKYVVLWVGTCVGIGRKMQPSREIVHKVHERTKKAMTAVEAYADV